MPYHSETKTLIEKAADQVPIGIQLEVNAEIFNTIRNLLYSIPGSRPLQAQHLHRLDEFSRQTVRAIAEVEERRGYGMSWQEQLAMLEEALAIMDIYIPEVLMEKVTKPEGDFVPPLPEETYDRAQADFVFDTRVWPVIAKSKPSQLTEPIAYLVGGQPGSGKSRMATTLIAAHPHQLIYGDTGNLFGFHPHYHELQARYGLYSIYITQHFAEYIAGLVFDRAIAERRHILVESNCTDEAFCLERIERLKAAGYRVEVHFRATPREESWLALQQLYQQQLIKAPALARIMSPEYHDWACDRFVETALAIRRQNLFDRLLVRSEKGLLYDSDDSPTESVAALLRERLQRPRTL
ncbi:MAG: zeta toxin family protein [Veillonellaceae bacterium]|nr:zeta toxin family protein [Veillonellaceae bacterium]